MHVAAGQPVWVDHTHQDPTASEDFYAQLLGWTYEDEGAEFGHYRIASAQGRPVAGLMQALHPDGTPDPDLPTSWTIYFRTDDIAAAVARATEAAGTVVFEPMAIGDFGSMAVVRDPAGGVFGLWQAESFAGFEHLGTGDSDTTGAPAWFELMSVDYDTALRFYTAVLGWDPAPLESDEGTGYSTNFPGEDAGAGICDATQWFSTSVWRVYFSVADMTAAVDTLTAAGGRLLDGPMDSPYGIIASVADPEGATFQLRQPPGD